MNEATLLEILRTNTELQRILQSDFDFRPLAVPLGTKSGLFQFSDGTHYELVGSDASGGEFALCDQRNLPARPLLYASSEGGAGIIARSLESGLAIIIDLPSWQDCLHFSGKGQLAEMRRVAPLSESDVLEAKPQMISRRETLRKYLGVAPAHDAIQELHSSLTELSPLYPVYGTDPDHLAFGTLFGKFTVMSNAAWRRRLTS
jgi:hypothetical protein